MQHFDAYRQREVLKPPRAPVTALSRRRSITAKGPSPSDRKRLDDSFGKASQHSSGSPLAAPVGFKKTSPPSKKQDDTSLPKFNARKLGPLPAIRRSRAISDEFGALSDNELDISVEAEAFLESFVADNTSPVIFDAAENELINKMVIDHVISAPLHYRFVKLVRERSHV